MNTTKTTIEEILKDFLDETDFVLATGPADTDDRDFFDRPYTQATQQLLDLFRDMTLEVIGRGSHTRKEDLSTYGFIEQEAVNKRLAAQRKALALKLKEKNNA